MNKHTLLCMTFGLALLAGCSASTHRLGAPALGKVSGSAEMERQIEQPGPIELETINSADWSASLGGLVNLDSPAAKQAGLKDRDEPIHVYAHLLRHPQRGNFLVDTGVSQKLLDDPAGAGLGWVIRMGMHTDKMVLRHSTAAIVQSLHGKLDGVMFTHLHIDHISGMPDIATDVPLYIGPNESTGTAWMNALTVGSTDALLAHKQPLQQWPFQPDPQGKFEGVLDVFGDASVFAISVPGHTPGSTAYLVRTTHGPVLLTGDTCHTRWGWEHTVEPGDFTHDQARNLANLKRLKELVARHPSIVVRFGHQL